MDVLKVENSEAPIEGAAAIPGDYDPKDERSPTLVSKRRNTERKKRNEKIKTPV